MCHKTHTMATRYGRNDIEDVPATQDSAALDLAPLKHPMPEGENESPDEYCEEIHTNCPFAEILEQFQQLKDQFASLKSTTLQSTATTELMQLTDKLQRFTMTLQSHSALQPSEEPVHKTMQAYTDTLHATERTSPQPCCKISPHLMDRTHQNQRTGS